MLTEDITEQELQIFTIIERVVSVFSLLGCLFVITTFAMSKTFHKPINRLVFYASIGNMMTNVATLMARTYTGNGSSPGCQLQAFLIQMFMPADAFWTLAMAVNVYLTFYFKYDAQKLRRMEIPYLLCCYGLPFIVALTYIFVETPVRGRVYGNATIWCWVDQNWDIWRIATFYGPVWVTIFVTFFIYIRAGREIYRKHKQLKDLNYTSNYDPEPLPMHDAINRKTTEVSVTVSNAQDTIDLSPLGASSNNKRNSISAQSLRNNPAAYSVSISARAQEQGSTNPSAPSSSSNTLQPPARPLPTPKQPAMPSRRKATLDAHDAAWSYTKCALLFFTAMLVTWIPSSTNRLYSLARDGQISLPLEYMSAFVLPLQGFWNAIIYITTSWKACEMFFSDLWASLQRKLGGAAGGAKKADAFRTRSRLGAKENRIGSGPGRAGGLGRMSKEGETESMEELAIRGGAGTDSPC